MTAEQLRHKLADAVATGKIGEPVAVRVHLQLPGDADPADAAGLWLETARDVFDAAPVTLMAQQAVQRSSLSLLLHFANGRTALLTIGREAAKADLHLLLIGNRGIVRLEGGELLDILPVGEQSPNGWWRERVEASLREASPVMLDGS